MAIRAALLVATVALASAPSTVTPCAPNVGDGGIDAPTNVSVTPTLSDGGGLTLTFLPSCNEGLGVLGYRFEATSTAGNFLPPGLIQTNSLNEVIYPLPQFDDGYWTFRVYAVTNGSLTGPQAVTDYSTPSSFVTVDATPPPAPTVQSPLVQPVDANNATLSITWLQPVDLAINGVSTPLHEYEVLIQGVKNTFAHLEAVTYPQNTFSLQVPRGDTYVIKVRTYDLVHNLGQYGSTYVNVPGPATHFQFENLGENGARNPALAFMGQGYAVNVLVVDDQGLRATDYALRSVRLGSDGGFPPVNVPAPNPYGFVGTESNHVFAGVKFPDAGMYLLSAFDPVTPSFRTDVWVQVIGPGQIVIDHDANPRATPGQPYQYNDAGAVSAHSSNQVTFSKCQPSAGSSPSAFNVDPQSGKVDWPVAFDLAGQVVPLCVQALSTSGGPNTLATYSFDVTVGYLDGGFPDPAPDAGFLDLDFQSDCSCSAGSMAPTLALAALALSRLRRRSSRA